jgi:hypothetical protein
VSALGGEGLRRQTGEDLFREYSILFATMAARRTARGRDPAAGTAFPGATLPPLPSGVDVWSSVMRMKNG